MGISGFRGNGALKGTRFFCCLGLVWQEWRITWKLTGNEL